jgi:hypothetical protein
MRRFTLALAPILLVLAPTASAQFIGPGGVVPVVANTPGLNGTLWRSDVSVTNLGSEPTSVLLVLLPEIRGGEPEFEPRTAAPIQLAAGAQVTVGNVLEATFGLRDAKGALSVLSTDGSPLLVSTRTYTIVPAGGTYGQDTFGVLVGSRAFVGGVAHDSFYRTNLGVFMPVVPIDQAVTFDVRVHAADGSEVGAGELVFTTPGVIQRSLSTFDVERLLDGWIELTCSDPSLPWYAYASRVDETTGDAVFRPARGFQADAP